jgi:hypothetical protein
MRYKDKSNKDNWRNIKRIKNSINIFNDEVNRSDLQTFRNYIRYGEQKKAMVYLYLLIEDLKDNTYSLFGYLWKKNIELFGFTEEQLLRNFFLYFSKERYSHKLDLEQLQKKEYQKSILEVEKEISIKERKEKIKEKIQIKYTYGYTKENKRIKARYETYSRISPKNKKWLQIIYRNKKGEFTKQSKY